MPVSRRRDIVPRNHEQLAMAGLVGILRQLGDLAELGADVFQELQDQVMDVSARGRRIAARAKQLEDDLNPLIDQEDFFAAAPNTERLCWHADPKVSHGVVAARDMPYFMAECIKQCRGPPAMSILDKYDADGDGACLRRYTNPSFFKANNSRQQDTGRAEAYLRGKENRPKFQSSEDCKPPKPPHTYAISETDPSENASPRFLSMLRLLKHRQTRGSVFSRLKPQLQQSIQKYESYPEKEKASSVYHSEVDISFTSSPDLNIAVDTSTTTENAKVNHQCNVQYQGMAIPYCGSDYGEQGSELGRTSSFEAWLSPDSRIPEHDVIEESYRDTSNGLFGHGTITRIMRAKQDSVTEYMSKTENSCSEDSDVLVPPLPPIPPMQWLSVKVHTGTIAHRKSLRKDHHKTSEGENLKTSEFANLVHSDEPWSEPARTGPHLGADTRLRQEPRRRKFTVDTDHHMQVPDRPTEKLIEDNENFDSKRTTNSAGHESTVSTSEASKHGNAAQVDAVQNSPACQSNQGQNESVFISAVQQLSKIPPPSVPKPKRSLLKVGYHGRYELRNGPGPIYPSRNLLDKKNEELLQQIKDEPLSVKPIHGSTSSNLMGSPKNSRVANILQRVDDIRQ